MTGTPTDAPPDAGTEPSGDLCARTLAMPADTNANGDIFGGWLLSQMDAVEARGRNDNNHRGYGFRACAQEGASRKDGAG